MCYHLLDPLERNIPVAVPEPIELDLVFLVAARRNVYTDISLEDVIVSMPVGNQNTDILQRASARSSVHMIGRNQRWTFRSRHPDKKLLIAISSPNTSAAQPDQALPLVHDPSFILQLT